jgi:hypothetical protein
MGSSEVSAQEHYETSPGRKVPRPSEQVKQEALRGRGLKAQAKDKSLRDKVVRGGGIKQKRQIDPKYKILSARSVPQWGDTNVSLIGDSGDALSKSGAAAKGGVGSLFAKGSDMLKNLFAAPPAKAPTPKPASGPAGSAVPGGEAQWAAFRKKPIVKVPKTAPKAPKSAKAPKAAPVPGGAAPKPGPKSALNAPLTEGAMRDRFKQMQAVQGGDTLGLAEAQGMKVNPWAKIVSNPMGSMLMQMAAMSAIEPIMYGLGIRSPILGGILPFMAMQSLPGLLESSAGIPRMQTTLSRMAERGKLKLPGAQPAVAQPPAALAPGLAKAGSVVIPRLTTVFG